MLPLESENMEQLLKTLCVCLLMAFFGLSGLIFSQSPDKEIQYSTGQFIDGRDGKIYKTVKIGDQIWLAENFAYLPYVCPADANGCGIWVYGYDGTDVEMAKSIAEYQEYGSLYTWHQARVLCPEGWHLPSDEEWRILERNIGIKGLHCSQILESSRYPIALIATIIST